jgi:hypothetical protein
MTFLHEFRIVKMRRNDGFTRQPLVSPPSAGLAVVRLKIMKSMRTLVVIGCACSLLAGLTGAAEKPAKKQTCCESAAAEGKECKHKCCVSAHKEGKSCEKCNPNKEDLKLLKKKADKKADK